jgi:hypothetical protein
MNKYLKYKIKYSNLRNKIGGSTDPNEYNEKLMRSIRNLKYDDVKSALSYGANVNYVDRNRTSPLIEAVANEPSSSDNIYPIVDLLLQQPYININFIGNRETALIRAIERNNSNLVSKLILAGADVNLIIDYIPSGNNRSMNSLNVAVRLGKLSIIEILLNAGARVNYKCILIGSGPGNRTYKQIITLLCCFPQNIEENVYKYLRENPLRRPPYIPQHYEIEEWQKKAEQVNEIFESRRRENSVGTTRLQIILELLPLL